MAIRFVYFDLGKVLLQFSHPRMIEQLAAAAGAPVPLVHEVVFGGLSDEFERGELTAAEFYERFCTAIDRRPELTELERACSDIFEPLNDSIQLANELRDQVPLGILSNTNQSHWSFVQEVFPQAIEPFGVFALSYELKVMKPHREIYTAAAALTGTPPDEIFFLDDRPENVEGARDAGWDAEIFTTAAEARLMLRHRGFAV
jgi:putative hydrolase of the HAD superfamily